MINKTYYRPLHLLLVPLILGGCPKKNQDQPSSSGKTTGNQVNQGNDKATAPLQVGMADPFARMSGPTAKALDRGYKALRQKKYDETITAFAEVVTALPDHTQTRYQLARAYLLAGKLTEARKELEEILARDFISYAGRADKSKEWKPLRDSPEWTSYQAKESAYKAAYSQGLDKGFVFVARSRPAKPNAEGKKLDMGQEVYHFDPGTSRYRKLTYTEGRVYAAMRSTDGKTLAFLTIDRMQKGERGEVFLDPQGGYLDLTALATVGPFKIAGAYHEVSIGFSSGAPAWATETLPGEDGGTFVIDTARTGMAKSVVTIEEERTWAHAAQVWHSGKGGPKGISISSDHRSFQVGDVGKVTASREIAETSIEWSPGKKRLTYAGKLDACKVLAEGTKAQKNELYVYDIDRKSAQRIDSGISEFETHWLDDNLLVYENGIGQKGTVNYYDLAAHKKTTLTPRHGAGLYGVPSLNCEKEEPPEEPEVCGDESCTQE